MVTPPCPTVLQYAKIREIGHGHVAWSGRGNHCGINVLARVGFPRVVGPLSGAVLSGVGCLPFRVFCATATTHKSSSLWHQ